MVILDFQNCIYEYLIPVCLLLLALPVFGVQAFTEDQIFDYQYNSWFTFKILLLKRQDVSTYLLVHVLPLQGYSFIYLQC